MSKMGLATYFAVAMLMAHGTAAGQQGAPPPPPVSTELARAGTTITGQPIALPPAPVEVVVSRTEIPAGGMLPVHRHPWPRYAIVQQGRLRVRYEAAGLVRDFGPGEVAIEAIDQWHSAEVLGAEPVRLIVIDHVPPGRSNMVRR